MPGFGTPGRSGGRNKKALQVQVGDGVPVSPRALSPRAAALFNWVIDKLRADDPKSGFCRIDGALIASFAEVLEDQERIASMLADDPANLGLLRARGQCADRIKGFSALLGCCPFDRSRQPGQAIENEADDAVADLLHRMSLG